MSCSENLKYKYDYCYVEFEYGLTVNLAHLCSEIFNL